MNYSVEQIKASIKLDIESKKHPKYLHKYFSLYDKDGLKFNLKDAIENNYLWFSKPSLFNDPFDGKIRVSITKSRKAIEKYFGSEMKIYPNHSAKTRREKRTLLRNLSRHPSHLEKQMNKHIETFLEQNGFCCFSRISKNILMWSHYADHHQGVCITFDTLELCTLVGNPLISPFKVEYTREYPKFDYIKDADKNDGRLYRVLTNTKSIDWKYEREHRIIKPFFGKLPISKNAIVGVKFGCNCNHDRAVEFKKLVLDNGYNPRFKQAVLNKDSFGIHYEDFKK